MLPSLGALSTTSANTAVSTLRLRRKRKTPHNTNVEGTVQDNAQVNTWHQEFAHGTKIPYLAEGLDVASFQELSQQRGGSSKRKVGGRSSN